MPDRVKGREKKRWLETIQKHWGVKDPAIRMERFRKLRQDIAQHAKAARKDPETRRAWLRSRSMLRHVRGQVYLGPKDSSIKVMTHRHGMNLSLRHEKDRVMVENVWRSVDAKKAHAKRFLHSLARLGHAYGIKVGGLVNPNMPGVPRKARSASHGRLVLSRLYRQLGYQRHEGEPGMWTNPRSRQGVVMKRRTKPYPTGRK